MQSLISYPGSSTSLDLQSRVEKVVSGLVSLLPPDAVSPTALLNSRTATRQKAFGLSFRRLLIISIENNFAGLEGVPIGDILTFSEHDPQMRSGLLTYFREAPKPVAKAVAEKLFRAAIENCNATLVKVLTKTLYVVPDEVVCTVDEQRYTAVERSVMLRSTEVTKVLLEAGADIHRTYRTIRAHKSKTPRDLNQMSLESGILGLVAGLFTRLDSHEPVDMQLINMLLGHGARVSVDALYTAVERRDAALIEAFMVKFPASEHSKLFHDTPEPPVLQSVVRNLDGDQATMTIKQIVQVCSRTHGCKCLNRTELLEELMAIAALKGYLELVKFLIDYTTDKDCALIAAVRGCRKGVIDFLLQRGANVNAVARHPGDLRGPENPGLDFPRTSLKSTPLAEAVWAGDRELVRKFESHGALIPVKEKKIHFALVIEAASWAGDSAYVQALLQEAPEVGGRVLFNALFASTRNGHEEIAFRLVRAGACLPRGSSFEFGLLGDDCEHYSEGDYRRLDSLLVEAVKRRSKALTHIVMEYHPDFYLLGLRSFDRLDLGSLMQVAVEWGDISIIKDLISLPGKCLLFSQNISLKRAVMARNIPLIDFCVKELGCSLRECSLDLRSPLEAAIENKDILMIQYLLELGADPSSPNIISSAVSSDRTILILLLDTFRARHPAGLKGFGGTALKVALEKGNVELVNMLLEAKFDLNAMDPVYVQDRQTAFGLALEKYGRSSLDLIKKLILSGGDPNSVVSEATVLPTVEPRRTALLQAIYTKNVALVELLIDEGADIHRPAKLGVKRTPLQYASEIGSMEIFNLLLAKGASVKEAPAVNGGGTSLQLCAAKGYAAIASKLVGLGSNVHADPSEVNGRTALEGAAENGRLDMIKVLWDAAGCNRFTVEQCKRAMKLAKRNGHIVCHDLLMQLRLTCHDFLTPTAFGDPVFA